ncbi:MAG: Abi family protein [Bacteroidaceae bacterium]|nr:Abi family protein [Bacteroidaceae bacterium]
MATTIPFSKGYSNPHDIISLLQSRGLHISDTNKAEHDIERIGYYRLSAYMYPFLCTPKELHKYKNNASFDKVMMLYRFDKKLRMLLFNEIEKIEVAVRSAIANTCCEITGNPFWMTDANYFTDKTKFAKTMQLIDAELRKSREDFIAHFKSTYSNPYPPAWMLSEILPFGIITNIYNNIKKKNIKKRVSQTFGLQIDPFESWLTIITLTHNSCCHHARVWNKRNTILATIPDQINRPWITLTTDYLRIYFNICIIKYFLDIVSPQNDMLAKLQWLFVKFPEVDLKALGFPVGWEMEPLWNA